MIGSGAPVRRWSERRKMIRIAIVEDEEKYRELFSSYIRRYAEEHRQEIAVTCFQDGLMITEDYKPQWDIILLDIQMKHQDGMSAARIIREHDPDVVLMFITTLAQYAIQGYEVDAADYVLKPVEYGKFAFRFERLLRRLPDRSDTWLLLQAEDGQDKVPVTAIDYIKVEHHDLQVYVGDKCYHQRRSISSMEAELPEGMFYRCDNAVLVRLSAVTHIGRDSVEVAGTVLPVSRSRRKGFLAAIAERS